MNASALIQTWDGIETPAPGRWTMVPGRLVDVRWRRGLRRFHAVAHTAAGALIVETSPRSVALELTLDTQLVPLPTDRLCLRATAVRLSDDGRWSLACTLPPELGFEVTHAVIRYRGVFRVAREADAWLTVQVRMRPSGVRTSVRRGVRTSAAGPGVGRPFVFTAELDARAPAALNAPLIPGRDDPAHPPAPIARSAER